MEDRVFEVPGKRMEFILKLCQIVMSVAVGVESLDENVNNNWHNILMLVGLIYFDGMWCASKVLAILCNEVAVSFRLFLSYDNVIGVRYGMAELYDVMNQWWCLSMA